MLLTHLCPHLSEINDRRSIYTPRGSIHDTGVVVGGAQLLLNWLESINAKIERGQSNIGGGGEARASGILVG